VETMRDSTGQVSDGEVLRARLHEDGYLYLRQVIDPDLVSTVRCDVLGSLQRAGWLGADGTLRPLVNGQQDPRYWAGFAGVQSLESFHRMAFDDNLTRIMSAIIGEGMYPWPAKAPYMMWPERLGGSNTKPHQEGVRWSEDVLATWISIGHTPVEQGALAVLPGSQTIGYVPEYGYGTFEFGPDWATAEFGPGDIVIFHNFTVHGSLPNRAESLRLSCSFKWQSSLYPAPEDAARPVRYPDVPAWEALTEGWSSLRWITPPPAAVFTDRPPGLSRPAGV
jgi:hypothetical protein